MRRQCRNDCPKLSISFLSTFLSMRLLSPPTTISFLSILLSSHIALAKPYPKDDAVPASLDDILGKRGCAIPCGWSGQLCCQAGQACFTDSNNLAQCGTGGVNQQNFNNGQWQLFTTAYVATGFVTVTSTYSSLVAATSAVVVAPPAVTNVVACSAQLQEIPCGGICCASGQYCQYQGQCAAVAGGAHDFSSSYYASVVNTGSAFIRPTSNNFQTVTSTRSATTTVPFQTPTGTSGGSIAGMQSTTSNNGLSGGAIAGIVIGTLFGIALLLMICACFFVERVAAFFLNLLGIGPRRKVRDETYIAGRHSSHGGGGAGGGAGRTWWGSRPARVERPKKSGGLGGFTTVAAGLGALALFLGLKRRKDRRDKSSYGSGSSYTYSEYTSTSM